MQKPAKQTPKFWLTVVMGLLLSACGGIELNETNPANPRLSGVWVLDVERSDTPPHLRDGMRDRRGVGGNPTAIRQQEIRGALGSGLAFIVHDFQVLTAQRLEIELNHDSMGIRYQPGVYRDVSWGLRDRGLWEIYAGWELDELVIVSKANEMRVIERMQRRGNSLQVKIKIQADDSERELIRVFNSQPTSTRPRAVK